MERVLMQTGHNTLKIMHRLPVYECDKAHIDRVNALERSGYGLVRKIKGESVDLSSIFTYSVIALALAGMIAVF